MVSQDFLLHEPLHGYFLYLVSTPPEKPTRRCEPEEGYLRCSKRFDHRSRSKIQMMLALGNSEKCSRCIQTDTPFTVGSHQKMTVSVGFGTPGPLRELKERIIDRCTQAFGPGGRGGLQPPQILGNSDFLGSWRKFGQSQFLKTSPCFYYYFEEINIFYFNLKSA